MPITGEPMSRITVQKRQKEMKRLEKQRMKAERRAQRKLAKNTENEAPGETVSVFPQSGPQN
jgi:hypothetical protein